MQPMANTPPERSQRTRILPFVAPGEVTMTRSNASRVIGTAGLVVLFTLAAVPHAPVAAASAPAAAASPGSRVQNPVSFINDVFPVLTKAGCNAGACHGSQYGKGGFKLSLLGYDPDLDYASIRKDALGRRSTLTEPEQSLILRKPAGQVPHGGGVRLPRDSAGYATLLAWL